MKINIIFPYNTWGGAFRSTYELSNRMARKGEDVLVYFPFIPYLEGTNLYSINGLKLFLRGIARSAFRRAKIPWFDLKVPTRMVPIINDFFIRDADIVVANHWPTAFSVNILSNKKGKKYYFIRDTEPWSDAYHRELAAFRLPINKIVVSQWIKDFLIEEVGTTVAGVVPNGTSIQEFKVTNKVFNKDPVISMIYSDHPMKGIPDGMKVLKRVKNKFPNVKILLFGFIKPKRNFNFDFIFRPFKNQLRSIYKQTDIFLSPSLQEGSGNPPREAMLAKCCVVATNVGCIPEVTIPGKTAIVVEPGDTKKMEDMIIQLIKHPKKLEEIAANGQNHIQKFTWDKSTSKLIKIFKNGLED